MNPNSWSLSGYQGFPRQSGDPVDYDPDTYTFTFHPTNTDALAADIVMADKPHIQNIGFTGGVQRRSAGRAREGLSHRSPPPCSAQLAPGYLHHQASLWSDGVHRLWNEFLSWAECEFV